MLKWKWGQWGDKISSARRRCDWMVWTSRRAVQTSHSPLCNHQSPPSPLPHWDLERLYKAFPTKNLKTGNQLIVRDYVVVSVQFSKSDSQFTSSPLKYQISCRRGRQTENESFPLFIDSFDTNLNWFFGEIKKTNLERPKWKRQTVFGMAKLSAFCTCLRNCFCPENQTEQN